MPKRKAPPRTPEEDREAFISAAHELGCNEEEAAFDENLRVLTTAKAITNPDLKKGKRK